jgi:hypothetical protein
MNKRDLIWLKLWRLWDSLWDSLLVLAFFWVVIAFLLFANRFTYIGPTPDATRQGQ